MARTVKVNSIPSYVTSDDFSRLFELEGCLEARLMGRQAESGEQLGYVEFQDVASATKAIQQLQGHMGLGGKGLRLEPSQSTLSQLTGTPAAGTGGQKRPREENGTAEGQAAKQQRSDAAQPQQQPDVATLLQGLDASVLSNILGRPAAGAPQQAYVPPAIEVPPPPPPPPQKPQQAAQQTLPQPRSPLSLQQHQHQHPLPAYAAPPEPLSYQQYAPPPSGVYQPEYIQQQPPTQAPGGYADSIYQQQIPDQQPYYSVPPTQQYQQQQPTQPTYQQEYQQAQYEPQYQQPPQQQYQPQYQQQLQSQQAGPSSQPSYGAPPPAQGPPLPQSYAQPPPQQTQQAPSQQYPSDASKTLYTEGFPSDASRREMAHIFRHFPGYKSLRVVIKDSKRFSGEKMCMAFVEFKNIATATEAMNSLQGYAFDLDDPESVRLHIKYARPMENPRALTSHGGGRGGRGHGRGGGHQRGGRDHHRGGRHGH